MFEGGGLLNLGKYEVEVILKASGNIYLVIRGLVSSFRGLLSDLAVSWILYLLGSWSLAVQKKLWNLCSSQLMTLKFFRTYLYLQKFTDDFREIKPQFVEGKIIICDN